MNKRNIGDFYEDLACRYIKEQGAKILQRNFRAMRGEIDIIATDGEYLCFIEVKYRQNSLRGNPEEAVNFSKQKQICRISNIFLISRYHSLEKPIRYDVIALTGTDNAVNIRWIKNAFGYVS